MLGEIKMLITHCIFIWFKRNEDETKKLIKRMEERNMPFVRYVKLASYFPIPYIRSICKSMLIEKEISVDEFAEKVKVFYGGEKNIKRITVVSLPPIFPYLNASH